MLQLSNPMKKHPKSKHYKKITKTQYRNKKSLEKPSQHHKNTSNVQTHSISFLLMLGPSRRKQILNDNKAINYALKTAIKDTQT